MVNFKYKKVYLMKKIEGKFKSTPKGSVLLDESII